MSQHETAGDSQPDLVAEARWWREWNTAVFARTHSHEEAERIAATLSPGPDRIEAILARAQTAHALRNPPAANDEDVLVQVHADAGRFFQSKLANSWVPEYLAGRGLDAVLLPTSPWKVGYAPKSWNALTRYLQSLGHSDDTLIRSGLVAQGPTGHVYDRFRGRLMIPLRRTGDRAVIAFSGRRHPDATDADGPKYLNSPNTDLYVKGHVLPGLAEGHRALSHGAQPVLVEGLTDAMAVSIAAPGTYVGVTPCGTALTPDQVALLARTVDLSRTGLRVALDNDDAGRESVIRAYAPLSEVATEMTAVTLPENDPAELLQNHGRQALRKALTTARRPLADLVVDARIQDWQHNCVLEDADAQNEAVRVIGTLIATMPPSEAVRQAERTVNLFARDYGWSPKDTFESLFEAVRRHRPVSDHDGASSCEAADGLPERTTVTVANAAAPVGPGSASHPDHLPAWGRAQTAAHHRPSASDIQYRE